MNILDLHGIRHKEARTLTIRFIEDNWNSNQKVEIVTGNSQMMQDVVVQVLKEYKLDYQVGGELGIDLAKMVVTLD